MFDKQIARFALIKPPVLLLFRGREKKTSPDHVKAGRDLLKISAASWYKLDFIFRRELNIQKKSTFSDEGSRKERVDSAFPLSAAHPRLFTQSEQ